jgi:hypothetical protein
MAGFDGAFDARQGQHGGLVVFAQHRPQLKLLQHGFQCGFVDRHQGSPQGGSTPRSLSHQLARIAAGDVSTLYRFTELSQNNPQIKSNLVYTGFLTIAGPSWAL